MSTLDPKKSYHHGDLRNALIAEAVAAARVEGPSAVVLRDIARRVGVSHNAGYRHFASREDLLAAVAGVGLSELADEMRRVIGPMRSVPDTPAQARGRLRAIGHAYVNYARSEPGLFRTIWAAAAYPVSPGLPATEPAAGSCSAGEPAAGEPATGPGPATGEPATGPATGEPATGSYPPPGARHPGAATLSTESDPYALLNAVLDDLVATGAIPASRRPYSEITAWSAVHGLSILVIDGPLAVMPAEAIAEALDRMTDIIDAGI